MVVFILGSDGGPDATVATATSVPTTTTTVERTTTTTTTVAERSTRTTTSIARAAADGLQAHSFRPFSLVTDDLVQQPCVTQGDRRKQSPPGEEEKGSGSSIRAPWVIGPSVPASGACRVERRVAPRHPPNCREGPCHMADDIEVGPVSELNAGTVTGADRYAVGNSDGDLSR
jgi:hypothetical protein